MSLAFFLLYWLILITEYQLHNNNNDILQQKWPHLYPKLKDAENYRPWAIYVQAILETGNVWNIVIGTKIILSTPSSFAIEATQVNFTLSV